MMKQASDPGAGNVCKELLGEENTAIYRTLQTYREDGEIPNGRTRIPRWDVRWSSLCEIVVMEPERGAGQLLRTTTQIKPLSCPINCRHVDSKPDRRINVQNGNPNQNKHLHVYFVKNNVSTSLKEAKTATQSPKFNVCYKIQDTYEQNPNLCLFTFSFLILS